MVRFEDTPQLLHSLHVLVLTCGDLKFSCQYRRGQMEVTIYIRSTFCAPLYRDNYCMTSDHISHVAVLNGFRASADLSRWSSVFTEPTEGVYFHFVSKHNEHLC